MANIEATIAPVISQGVKIGSVNGRWKQSRPAVGEFPREVLIADAVRPSVISQQGEVVTEAMPG